MGVWNFCRMLHADSISTTRSPREPFDVILLDAQSFIYRAIDETWGPETEEVEEHEEDDFFDEVCSRTWFYLRKAVEPFVGPASSPCRVMVAFDGDPLPMKWPLMRKRRSKIDGRNGKDLYRLSLFGRNLLGSWVVDCVMDHVTDKRNDLHRRWSVSGCDRPGEAKHKLFEMASSRGCRRPLVVSLNQDVFLLALARDRHFDSIQIVRDGTCYAISTAYREKLPTTPLKVCSILFGNDFVPPLVYIMRCNKKGIRDSLEKLKENSDPADPPAHRIASFLDELKDGVRFRPVAAVSEEKMIDYWTMYFWMWDYFEKDDFAQKYMRPVLPDLDRNEILTGLSDRTGSGRAYEKARERYEKMVTAEPESREEAERAVFADDEELLESLRPYWRIRDEDKVVVVVNGRWRLRIMKNA